MTKKRRMIKLDQPSLLEAEIIRIVDKAIINSKVDLAVDDIKVIAHEVLPDIDRLIANKVSQHFLEIGKFLVDKFKLGD